MKKCKEAPLTSETAAREREKRQCSPSREQAEIEGESEWWGCDIDLWSAKNGSNLSCSEFCT